MGVFPLRKGDCSLITLAGPFKMVNRVTNKMEGVSLNDPRRGDEERYQVSKGRKSRGARR